MVTIPNNNLKELIDSLTDSGYINSLIALQKDLQAKVDILNQSIFQYQDAIMYINAVIDNHNMIIGKTVNSFPHEKSNITRRYNPEWKLPKKVIHILVEEKRFLKFREIAKIIVEKDGKGNINQIARQLTHSTKALKKDEVIVRITPTGKDIDTFWGFPDWLDENWIIKPEYMFDFNSVKVINELKSPYKEMYKETKK